MIDGILIELCRGTESSVLFLLDLVNASSITFSVPTYRGGVKA